MANMSIRTMRHWGRVISQFPEVKQAFDNGLGYGTIFHIVSRHDQPKRESYYLENWWEDKGLYKYWSAIMHFVMAELRGQKL